MHLKIDMYASYINHRIEYVMLNIHYFMHGCILTIQTGKNNKSGRCSKNQDQEKNASTKEVCKKFTLH